MIRTGIRAYTQITSGIRTSGIIHYLKHAWVGGFQTNCQLWIEYKSNGGYIFVFGIILILHCMWLNILLPCLCIIWCHVRDGRRFTWASCPTQYWWISEITFHKDYFRREMWNMCYFLRELWFWVNFFRELCADPPPPPSGSHIYILQYNTSSNLTSWHVSDMELWYPWMRRRHPSTIGICKQIYISIFWTKLA